LLTVKQHNTGEMTLNYAEGDDSGDPIVFIHGIGGRWQQWSQEIGLVSHAWHPYSVDLRGHGKSSKPETGYKFGDYPRDIISLLENEIDGPAVLVAHSLGAVTTIGVASRRPDLVRAVVLEDPPIFSHQRLGRSRRADEFGEIQALARKNLSASELIPLVAERYRDQTAAEVRSRAVAYSDLDPEVYTPTLDGSTMDGFDAEASLSAIECPALLLQADPDMGAAMTNEEAERAAGLIPDCAFVQMKDVGHGIHRGDPINFRRALFDFLDTI
jgi:pimeloyl-ACP methyl ester carboxylesterase